VQGIVFPCIQSSQSAPTTFICEQHHYSYGFELVTADSTYSPHCVSPTDNFLLSSPILTPKVLANSSPLVALWQPWDQDVKAYCYPERVYCVCEPLQGLMGYWNFLVPGLPKRNHWAGIGEHLRRWILFTAVLLVAGPPHFRTEKFSELPTRCHLSV
jgi:hypothetical protein